MKSEVSYRTLDLLGFPGYRVGDDGSVWSCRPRNNKGKFLNQWVRLCPGRCRDGYYKVTLCTGARGKTKNVKLHKLILLAFVGPCPPGMEACHDPDPNPANNHVENLRWDTRKGNMVDRKLAGGFNHVGVKNNRAKLTVDDVRQILVRINGGSPTKK